MAFLGEISAPNEVDLYSVYLVPNTTYIALAVGDTYSPQAAGKEALPNPFIGVLDLDANDIASSNGQGGFTYPAVDFTVPAEGNYVLMVGDQFGSTGAYDAAIVDYATQVELPGALVGEYIIDPPTDQVRPTGVPPAEFYTIPFL